LNVVFLSPHFPPQMAWFCVRLREAGANVLGIGDAPYDELRPELREALTEYYRVPDLHDTDALIRAFGWFIHRHGRIDRVDSLNEWWLETEAKLRTWFDVPGIRLDAIERIKRKSAMKEVFASVGVPGPRGKVCATSAELRALIDEIGYPIVAKPDIGVGAHRTYRIASEADLAAFLAEATVGDYICEEFLAGDLLSYDGLVDREGRIVFDASITYGISVLDSVEGGEMAYWIDRTIPSDLVAMGRRLVEAFGVRERPFHFEFFRLPDGTLRALEINMRQPGGLTVDMWDWANDMDFYRAWAEVVVTGTSPIRPSRAYVCLWAGRKDGHAYRLTHDEIMTRYRQLVVHHERMAGVFAAAIGSEGYILKSPELAILREAAAAIQA
jgi:hypothetical protein